MKSRMQKTKDGFLAEIISSRVNLIEILLIALILGLGVSLIANGFPILLRFSPLITVIIGIVLCAVSGVYFLIRSLSSRKKSYEVILAYDKKNNKLIPIDRYYFSQFTFFNFYCAFSENKALKSIWDKEPMHSFSTQKKEKKLKIEQYGSGKLICEATEYIVLELLMWALLDYFDDEEFRKKDLKELGRNDIPEVLLSNRFLELFSRPMADRPSMVEDVINNKKEEDTLLRLIFIKKGKIAAKYQSVKLVLPRNSVISRPLQNQILIETDKLILTLSVLFKGVNAVLPNGFEESYLKFKRTRDLEAYKIDVDLKVKFKLGTLFSGAGLRYYHWVDSFLNILQKMISSEEFFKTIGWETAITVIEGLQKSTKIKKSTMLPF